MNKQEKKYDDLSRAITLFLIYQHNPYLVDAVTNIRTNFKPKYKNNWINIKNKDKAIDLSKDEDIEKVLNLCLKSFNKSRGRFQWEKSAVKDELMKWIK